ncbi:MAG: 30S ribosomal protein S6 [candidate division Zixibacteria bacterium]|nr:30S ribosomal protein S6 [candidate division Zixibacteria bacterium]
MRIYETTFIVNPQTDDATIDNRVAAISGIITRNGGKIVCEDHMGTRRLAYPIKGLTQGYYGSFIFEAPSDVLPLIDLHFRQDESYVRFLTVEFEGNVADLMERTSASAAISQSAEKPAEVPEPVRPVAQRRPETPPEAPRVKRAEEEPKEEAPAEIQGVDDGATLEPVTSEGPVDEEDEKTIPGAPASDAVSEEDDEL